VPTVARISITPVKGFRLEHPEEVELTERGVVENRRFLLAGADGKRVRSSKNAWHTAVGAEYDAAAETLRMRFPDGSEVEGPALPTGEPFLLGYHAGRVEVRPVAGEWAGKLSELAGYGVQLVRPGRVGETLDAPVTLVSTASVARLEREAGRTVDARRFRMLFDLAGCEPHEEDGWEGRPVRIGGAVVRPTLAVERCAVTTRDPETGRRDLETLHLIRGYREPRGDVEIPFGMLADVEVPGRVRVGDSVEPL
jgi:uncharacterized protein YcbX